MNKNKKLGVNKPVANKLKTFAHIMEGLALFLAVINKIPPKKNVEKNPFIVGKGKLPLVASHRAGAINNPENTLLAFRECVLLNGSDIIESDLHLTKDGYLVLSHDRYIDRTCNINGDISLEEVLKLCEDESKRHYINDMTLAELQQYNFGYYFTDKNGNRIYKDTKDFAEKGLKIITVEQLFDLFYESHPDLMFTLDIKDDGETGFKVCKLLNDILNKYPNYKDQVSVGTFHDEIGKELDNKYPDLIKGAPPYTAAFFVITQYLKINLFCNRNFACLQIPTSHDFKIFELPLVNKSLVERAHLRNIAVHYWTINDPNDMRTLIELGVDCIMTDDPILLNQVLDEYR